MPYFKLLKLRVSAAEALKMPGLFPGSTRLSDRLSFVENLPQVLCGGVDFGHKLRLLFELEEVPDPNYTQQPEPEENPARTELVAHLKLFKKALADGQPFSPPQLEALIASTEEALDTMHEMPWAG